MKSNIHMGVAVILIYAMCISLGCRSRNDPKPSTQQVGRVAKSQPLSPWSHEAIELANIVNMNNAAGIRAWTSTGRDPDIIYLDGGTVLHGASAAGYVESVRALLDAGANPNIPRKDGRTPLHFAAQYRTPGQLKVISMLLKAGGDPRVKDANGKTAHDYAAMDTNIEAQEMLTSTR